MEEFAGPPQEAQFNAGLAMAQHLHELFCGASIARLDCRLVDTHKLLHVCDLKLSAEFRGNKEARKEVETIKAKHSQTLNRFIELTNRGIVPPPQLNYEMSVFLDEYESSLLYWRNKFGYGMPQKADAKAAAFR